MDPSKDSSFENFPNAHLEFLVVLTLIQSFEKSVGQTQFIYDSGRGNDLHAILSAGRGNDPGQGLSLNKSLFFPKNCLPSISSLK